MSGHREVRAASAATASIGDRGAIAIPAPRSRRRISRTPSRSMLTVRWKASRRGEVLIAPLEGTQDGEFQQSDPGGQPDPRSAAHVSAEQYARGRVWPRDQPQVEIARRPDARRDLFRGL